MKSTMNMEHLPDTTPFPHQILPPTYAGYQEADLYLSLSLSLSHESSLVLKIQVGIADGKY